MTVFRSKNLQDTEHLGEKIASLLRGCEVIAFFGGLGMGKTTLTRAIANALGTTSDVSSPTFAIVNEYKAKYNIYHFDMYRITSWEDLYSTGFFDYLNEDSVLFIEWSENIENALPEDTVWVEIAQGKKENDRVITVTGGGF